VSIPAAVPQLIEVTTEPFKAVVFDIRRRVFVEEQAVDPEEEYDEYEDSSRHFLLQHNGIGLATGRFRSTTYGWKIERMAVLADYRAQGFGMLLLQGLLPLIPNDGRPIYLHAQEHALLFYQKAGFIAQGERFYEANIPHFKMELSRK